VGSGGGPKKVKKRKKRRFPGFFQKGRFSWFFRKKGEIRPKSDFFDFHSVVSKSCKIRIYEISDFSKPPFFVPLKSS